MHFQAMIVFSVVLATVSPTVAGRHGHYHHGSGSGWSNSSCPRTTPEQNRRLAIDFRNTVFNNLEYDKIDRFVAENYIGHNPDELNGLDAQLTGIPAFMGDTPKDSFQIMRSAVDRDIVWLHIKMHMYGQDYAVVDIVRVECGKIAEHWDVVQAMDAMNTTSNPAPYF